MPVRSATLDFELRGREVGYLRAVAPIEVERDLAGPHLWLGVGILTAAAVLFVTPPAVAFLVVVGWLR